MNPSYANILSGTFEILKDKRLWRPAVAGGLLALTVLWLCVLRKHDSPMDKWATVIPGPYRFELAYDDTLAAIKSAATLEEASLSLNVKMDSAAVFVLRKSSWRGPVEIIVADFPESIFSGALNFYEQLVTTGKNKKDTRIRAVIEVMNPEKLLTVGMRIRTAVLLDTSSQAFFLPDGAIFEMNGEAIVFPRSDSPEPRIVQVGPRSAGNIMVAEGIKAGEELALSPPHNLTNVQPLSWDTYRKLLPASRQKAMQFFVERLDRSLTQDFSDSFVVASEGVSVNNKTLQASIAGADCTTAIDQMLLEDSSRGIAGGRVRIGPGEGGKLAPVSPETLQTMKPGEKISVSVPAQSDSSTDTLHMEMRPTEPDSSTPSQQPPEEF